MRPHVRLVVTCTERKSRPIAPELSLRALPPGTVESRVAEWHRRLAFAPGSPLPAIDLYTGNHWSVVRSLGSRSADAGGAATVWVASAGYGLIPLDAPIHSYAATFAGGADRVGASADEIRQWWEVLATTPGPAANRPRSLAALAAESPGSPLLVVLSAAYARALEWDLTRAARCLHNPGDLVILSTGLRDSGALKPYVLTADARFRHVVGGQMHSLNARLAGYVLDRWSDWAPDTERLRSLFSAAATDLPAMQKYDRAPQSDEDVRAFIRNALQAEPGIGHSTLLRRLRAGARACEQKRFKAIFQQVSEEIAA